jgi:hypothetical protein
LWAGPLQFALASSAATFIYPFLLFFTSIVVEERPISDIRFWHTLLSPVSTFIVATPIYFVLLTADILTQKEHPKTAESEAL